MLLQRAPRLFGIVERRHLAEPAHENIMHRDSRQRSLRNGVQVEVNILCLQRLGRDAVSHFVNPPRRDEK